VPEGRETGPSPSDGLITPLEPVSAGRAARGRRTPTSTTRAAPTTLDVRPFDDQIVRVVVVRSDESTPDGPLSGATAVELRITTGDA
jgi:hypothetical protein